jgi:hypothetical protein
MKGQKAIMGLTKRHLLYAGVFTAALSGMVLGGCTQTAEAPETTVSAAAPTEVTPPMPKDAVPATAPAGEATNPAGTTPPGPPTGAGAPPMMGGGNAPFAGGMGGDPNAPLSPSPELDKKIADAEKGKDKKAIAAAYAERGTVRMNDDKSGAKVKYRAALEDFRKALSADPTNQSAKASKDTIESIYTSMGRPIPK